MEYCKRCVYPANAKPVIIFDEQGICSGCRLNESRRSINWDERRKWLDELMHEYKLKAKDNRSPYDCIVPISGGKDSTFQVYVVTQIYKMNPLLVCFNHSFNTKLGIRNLNNLVKQFNCDMIRFTVNRTSALKLSKYMLKKVGDITWHYHAGIMTFPIQMAVKYKIPLMIWGEEGFSELTGMFNQDDMIEFTKMKRQEHSMRGFEPEDLINDPTSGIEPRDVVPYFYPSEEEIEELDLRGIYLGNYISWNGKAQAEKMIKEWGFHPYATERDRTFNRYDKTDDAANGTHDYLKYLKFGYGRATDDASTEIRHGRMSREEGIEMVKKHDHVRPQDLDFFLDHMNMTEEEFVSTIDPMRDPQIWTKDKNGRWMTKDCVANHVHDQGVEEARVTPAPEKTRYLSAVETNGKSYYNDFIIS